MLTFYYAYANINTVMKESTTNNQNKNIKNNDEVNIENVDLSNDIDIQAHALYYEKADRNRQIALMGSLMGNMFFLISAYAILTYDNTGQLFASLLGY